jgi:hypothetical protein
MSGDHPMYSEYKQVDWQQNYPKAAKSNSFDIEEL